MCTASVMDRRQCTSSHTFISMTGMSAYVTQPRTPTSVTKAQEHRTDWASARSIPR